MAPSNRLAGPEIVDMTDFQLLVHLLGMAGTGPAEAQELAYALLDAHQDLARVLALPGDTLSRFPGLGEKAAVFLHFLPALMDRYAAARDPSSGRARLWVPGDAARFLEPYFLRQSVERICVFCLGKGFELLTTAMVSQGSDAAVTCSVSRVLRLALTHRAESVILAHNHPDGAASFSKSDLLATGVVSHALSTVEIPLSDHLLLAGREIISLRELFFTGKITDLPFSPPQSWLGQPWTLEQILSLVGR